ncbi:heavy metal translocating P-type ATPase [Telmatospirillum sp.]|uniref:heavy metal translocating P-type ATPase n=1 Tax=Telmatospirillum sp. TaxID=2079197 RepID=UPI00283B2DC6|nr:heavy metal translocating P-type ATPase [Telmatospirillum sp.]MDR3437367.1 heavy metal translocating P-type ATPase [Telmatospirillum sp.]
MASANPLKFHIEGMDCGACAAKIETALQRLPGVSDVDLSFVSQSLCLLIDERQTPRTKLLTVIKDLGYDPTPLADKARSPRQSGHGNADHEDLHRSWWSSPKARLVGVTGLLLAFAGLVSLIEPRASRWAYAAATVIGLVPIGRRGLAAIRSGTPFGIETLMSIAAIGAIAIDKMEEAAVVLFLFAVGELLESVAANRARTGIQSLIALIPRMAIRQRGSDLETVPVDDLVVGDSVAVRPGDRIPSDGIVLEGTSEVNEAPVTGESTPIAKHRGSVVFAGSINANGALRVEITRTAADNTIARIVHLVEEAQATKAPMARAIDRFSRWYTPMAMIAAALVILIPPLLFGWPWSVWLYRGLAVLLIACPCALVISTPAAVASGLASAARRGLLIKGGSALETLGQVTTVAFDKTGTLTEGRPQLTDIVEIEGTADDILAMAAAVEMNSAHPLGVAIVAEARARGLVIAQVFDSTAIPGKAVTGHLTSALVSVSSPSHAAQTHDLPEDLEKIIEVLETAGKTVVAISHGHQLAGLLALRDEPRADAREGLARLRALGVHPVMLSGDNRRTADAIAGMLAIDVKAELSPDAKLGVIAAYKKEAAIAMVGDGINDAPALAAASVGIAMGGGTDVALETADATLLKNRIVGVSDLIALARATLATIRQNIALTLGLKSLILVGALVGATPLWMAILADTGATVLVTANALRLLRFKFHSR